MTKKQEEFYSILFLVLLAAGASSAVVGMVYAIRVYYQLKELGLGL